MTRDVAQAFSNLNNQMNELCQRIDNLYSQLHIENVENIDVNAVGIDGLAETIEMQNEALNDLAIAVAELEG